jgi:hypothetical protein
LCRQMLAVGVRFMALLSDTTTSHRCATTHLNLPPYHDIMTYSLKPWGYVI